MPIFTSPGETPVFVDPAAVERLRPSFPHENGGHIGTTLFRPMLIVMEPVSVVGPALNAERASFVRLTGLGRRALWFDAARAGDARPPRPHEAQAGVGAVVPVGGIGMKVVESVARAQAVIEAGRAALA